MSALVNAVGNAVVRTRALRKAYGELVAVAGLPGEVAGEEVVPKPRRHLPGQKGPRGHGKAVQDQGKPGLVPLEVDPGDGHKLKPPHLGRHLEGTHARMEAGEGPGHRLALPPQALLPHPRPPAHHGLGREA